jgi:hypothetical protein
MHKKFLSENLKSRDHSVDLGIDGRIILSVNFKTIDYTGCFD